MSSSPLMTIKEAKVYLNMSDDTLYRLVKRKQIPFTRIGKLLRFSQESLDAWIAEKTMGGTPPPPPPAPATTTRKRVFSQPVRPGYTPIQPVPRNL